tara:strand:+ start:128 stop:295 length:168 start_codon:yes stop_codon:yes gene_type:complete
MPYISPGFRKASRLPQKREAFVPEKKYTTKEEVFEKIRLEKYGKADSAWVSDDEA